MNLLTQIAATSIDALTYTPKMRLVPHFGEQLARIRRVRTGLSQERLARLSGLSRPTISRAEAAPVCNVNPSTMLLILKALAQTTPPLDAEEAVWLGSQANVDRSLALSMVPRQVDDGSRQSASSLMSELVTLVGADRVTALLQPLVEFARDARRPRSDIPAARSLLVKHPPTQREGYIEQVHVDYEVQGDPPAVQQKPKKRREIGF